MTEHPSLALAPAAGTPKAAPATSPGAPAPSTGGAPAGVSHPKTIKSFVRRAGRTTIAQAKAFQDLGPRFVLPYAAAPLHPAEVFGRSAPLVLEIGFGMGEATAHIARGQLPVLRGA